MTNLRLHTDEEADLDAVTFPFPAQFSRLRAEARTHEALDVSELRDVPPAAASDELVEQIEATLDRMQSRLHAIGREVDTLYRFPEFEGDDPSPAA